MSSGEHKQRARKSVSIAIITVSTSRTMATDKSGRWIRKYSQKEGHEVVLHRVIPDDTEAIIQTVLQVIREQAPHALLLTGGTGIGPTDCTIESVRPLFDKELTAFGPIFSQLSFDTIDSAALLSRATAGIIGKTIVFCMPGSMEACKLACATLIFPELGHLTMHLHEG